jgi:hypothetical protein
VLSAGLRFFALRFASFGKRALERLDQLGDSREDRSILTGTRTKAIPSTDVQRAGVFRALDEFNHHARDGGLPSRHAMASSADDAC